MRARHRGSAGHTLPGLRGDPAGSRGRGHRGTVGQGLSCRRMQNAAGFAETGKDGVDLHRGRWRHGDAGLQRRRARQLRRSDGRHDGPVRRTRRRVERGVAICSQCGGLLCDAVFSDRGLPITHMAGGGNQAVTGMESRVAYLLDDPRVTAVGLFVRRAARCRRPAAGGGQGAGARQTHRRHQVRQDRCRQRWPRPRPAHELLGCFRLSWPLVCDNDGKPIPPQNLVGDYAAGGGPGVCRRSCGVACAGHTGLGQRLTVSMTEGIPLPSPPTSPRPRSWPVMGKTAGATRWTGAMSTCGCYETTDGRWIAVGALDWPELTGLTASGTGPGLAQRFAARDMASPGSCLCRA